MLEVVPATKELLTEYYGEPQDPRVRAFVALLDGKPIGVGGIAYRGQNLEVFSDLQPEMKRYKLTIYKVARKIRDILREKRLPAFAVANPDEPTADAFLRRIGFEKTDGGLYLWLR